MLELFVALFFCKPLQVEASKTELGLPVMQALVSAGTYVTGFDINLSVGSRRQFEKAKYSSRFAFSATYTSRWQACFMIYMLSYHRP